MFASTATLAYDTGLADGTYYGTGNSNAGWTSLTDGSLELGLGAIIRYVGPAPEVGSDYYVPPGNTTVPSESGPAWGFDFSVDTNVGGTGGPTSGYTYSMVVTDLTTSATTGPFDPSLIPDNYTTAGVDGFQNAENLSFGFPGYDVNASDTYQISLSATPVTGGSTDTVTIDVNVTPEPATFGLIGFGLLGLVAAARRKLSA